jgi:hypothetical protein
VTTDKIKLALITNYVRGMALNTLMRYKSEANPTWDGFTKLLGEQYEDSNLDYKLRTQFFHLQMENIFPRYFAKFHELLNQLPSLTYDNQTVLDKFTDGLTKEMAFHVKREKCQTLNQAIEICNDLHCLTTNDDKIEKINFVRINFNSNKGRKSFNNNGVNRSNNQTKRTNKQPYKKIENKRNFSKPFIKTNSFVKNNFKSYNGSKSMTNKGKMDMNKVTCYKCKKKVLVSGRPTGFFFGPAWPRAEGYRPGPARIKKARAGPRAFCIFSIFSFLVKFIIILRF